MITVQSNISVKTLSLRNDGESEKTFTCSAPYDLPNNLLKYCTRALTHPVYILWLICRGSVIYLNEEMLLL
jgi:hypothetical protein